MVGFLCWKTAKMASSKRCFVEWEEQFVSHDRGSRVVHYFLKDQHGNAVLAVVGTERSLRHMVYVVSEEFLSLPGVVAKPSFKWRSRREVVDWLTSLVSRGGGDLATSRSWRHDSPRISDTDLSNGEEIDEQNNYQNKFKGKISKKGRATSKGITWLGNSWTCRKRLKHYESFHRSGITISVNDFVYVMAEENMHHLAYLEDMYEDKKYQKKVKVRWFHRKNEVAGNIPSPPAHVAEVFITPFRQVLSVECVDGLAVILTPEHYEKCLGKLSPVEISQVHICFRQFDNEGIKSFNLNEMQGYWQQEILKTLGILGTYDSSKRDLSDSMDIDVDDADMKVSMRKGPRRTRCSRKRSGTSSGGNSKERNKAKIGNMGAKAGMKDGVCGGVLYSHSVGLPSFSVGDDIEVLCQDSGIRGCWFRCTVLKMLSHKMKVMYKDVLNEDDTGKLEEWIPAYRIAGKDNFGMRINGRPTIRPSPAEEYCGNFDIGSIVDAWWNDGWWEGVVVMMKEPSALQVFFPGENFYLTLVKNELRHSKEWVQNKWIKMEKNVDLAASLLLYETSQAPDNTCLRSSTLSNDYLGYAAAADIAEHCDSSDKMLCLLSQLSTRELSRLTACEEIETDTRVIDAEVVKEEVPEVGEQDNSPKVEGRSKNSLSPDENVTQYKSDDTTCSDTELGSDSDDEKPSEFKWKSSRKRQRQGETGLPSQSGTTCDKEETKRQNTGKLLQAAGMEEESAMDICRKREMDDPKEKGSIQDHETVSPMHGASSLNEVHFISSVPVASLVMSV